MRNRRRSYKFTEKKHSKRALVALSMATVSLGTYLAFVYLSYRAAGELSMYYGAVGVLAMLVAMVSLGLSVVTLKEEDSFVLFPRLAVVIAGLSTLLWVGNYVQGFMRG